ncbi:MAG: HigA family addiction module antidote protein [Verrucomicrobia bacterium]|nr:HigA family addiction module antidote protein [Verrucomicrobiota bacterium]
MSKSLTITKDVPLGPALVKPGEILEHEFLLPSGLTQSLLADKMGVERMRVSEIIRGQRSITADTALRLAEVFGTTAQFWMGLQSDYDLAIAVFNRVESTTIAKQRKGLDDRGRDKSGQIEKKHGNTLVRTLRQTYGENFAPGVRGDMKLENLLKREKAASLTELLKRHGK